MTTVPQRVIDRILARVVRDTVTGCWIWPGALTGPGYGHVAWNESGVQHHLSTHRAMYLATVGEIADGLELDHLCRMRRCCNPAHLEAVTRQTNLRRGESLAADRARQSHCSHGHELTPENTYRDKQQRRICRECTRRRNREASRHRRAQLLSGQGPR